jgi:hypothetical protein
MTSPLNPLASNDLLSGPWIVTRNRFSVTKERESAARIGYQTSEVPKSRAGAPWQQASRRLMVFEKRSRITVELTRRRDFTNASPDQS